MHQAYRRGSSNMRVDGAVCFAVLLCICSCRVGASTSRPSQRESSWWRTSLMCSDAESAISLDCESPSNGLIVEDSDLPPMRAFSGPGVAVLRGEHERCTSLKVSCTGAPLPIDVFQYGGECRVHVVLPGGMGDTLLSSARLRTPVRGCLRISLLCSSSLMARLIRRRKSTILLGSLPHPNVRGPCRCGRTKGRVRLPGDDANDEQTHIV